MNSQDNVDVDEAVAVAAGVAALAAAAFASLSTLSASLMCRGDKSGMLRNCESVDPLRLGGLDQDANVADCEDVYGDESERVLVREGMDRGCK